MLRRSLALASTVLVLTAAIAVGGTAVSFPSGSETIAGYLAVPEGAAKRPAIVVIHEWWGLNDWVKSKADDFAKAGYVALAVDLYRGKVATDPDMAHQLMRGVPEDRAVRDMKAAVAYLRSRPEVDGVRIASIGWCWGGGMSLDLAVAEPTMAGAVIYYGHLMTDPKTIEALKVPLLGNFGGQDQGIPPETVREFEALAKKDGKSVDFKVYPDAGHGFASGKDPKSPADAKDADARTDAFLARVLKESSGK
jgi:carboxymethylenebutenolidase